MSNRCDVNLMLKKANLQADVCSYSMGEGGGTDLFLCEAIWPNMYTLVTHDHTASVTCITL